MPDYIPAADAEFDSWQISSLAYLNAKLAALGLTPTDPDVLAVNAGQTAWTPAYSGHIAAQAATAAKNTARASFEVVLRRLFGRLRGPGPPAGAIPWGTIDDLCRPLKGCRAPVLGAY